MVDTYRVRVRGHLDDRWSDWLGGLAVLRRDDGTTVLVGPVVDQAALHGVIARIRDLGLPLLSVNRVVGSPGGPRRDGRTGEAMPTWEGNHRETRRGERRRRINRSNSDTDGGTR
jgi:hypothetical protein